MRKQERKGLGSSRERERRWGRRRERMRKKEKKREEMRKNEPVSSLLLHFQKSKIILEITLAFINTTT